MNKQALSAFLNGQITTEAASLFKKAVALDGAIDVKNKVKSESDVALKLESIDRTIGDGNVKVKTLNQTNEPLPIDVIMALTSGKKGSLVEAKTKAVEMLRNDDTYSEIEKPILNKVVNNNKKTEMSTDEIKEYIRGTVYDYIINEALGKKRLEKLVNEILKDNAKIYLKEALIELKNNKNKL